MDPSDLDDLEGVVSPGRRNVGVALGLLATLALAGVFGWGWLNPSADDLADSANINLVQREPDVAIAKYERALELVPEHAGAHRGLAKAWAQKGDKDKAGIWLEKAWALPGLPRGDKGAVKRDLAKHYLALAKSLRTGDPSAYGKALEKAVEYGPGGDADGMLATHLVETAALEAKGGRYTVAGELVARVPKLKARSRLKEQARDAEAQYRYKAFLPDFEREFAIKHKERLVKDKTYDAEVKRFGVRNSVDAPPRPGENPNLHSVRIRNLANRKAKERLLKFLEELAGASSDKLKGLPSSLTAWQQFTWTEGYVIRPRRYELGVSISWEDASRLVFLMRHGHTLAHYKPPKK